MKIGFDWGGVLDEFGAHFAQVATALKSGGHEIYVVSAINAGEEEARKQQVESIMPGICTEVLTLVARWEDQPEAKLKIIKEKGIEWFFDDREDINTLLRQNGIMAFTVKRIGQAI